MFILKFFRYFCLKFFLKRKKPFFSIRKPKYTNQKASDVIYDLLVKDKPCMISRLGNTEFNCVYRYKTNLQHVLKQYQKYIIGDIDALSYSEKIKSEIKNNAGFFPVNNKNLDKFSKMMLNDIKNIDILGSWLFIEENFKNELKNVTTINLEDLNAYNHENPWSRVLKNKKVLVIHPFVKSIKEQYKKRDYLFENKNILPEFELITYKPVVSFAGNYKNIVHKTWFDALESMKKDISKINFDIAIIGCGAYGLPLASYVKSIGKKSVHLGGATQMLFGIKGKRWEVEYELEHLFNKHWVRPAASEIPKNADKVEKGCYW